MKAAHWSEGIYIELEECFIISRLFAVLGREGAIYSAGENTAHPRSHAKKNTHICLVSFALLVGGASMEPV